ncbi:sodium- and chloride-dependent neutral and basic amino acid transporter B(0+)-like [Bombina bombina]|uniref:sodium- and chloride-dependent neutral and basic amino acid transporter B(0+)-like n=1 Tax=Bombina bombina TaxID=8345 RepID=UPI00235A9D4D|nr:sodium- and chloride-dependent neutral and basic amino acid transporter B(0+)-like [Bombina bombina]
MAEAFQDCDNWTNILSEVQKSLFTENKHEIGANASSSDENIERGNWSRKSDYLLSMIGYAVGLGNVWRFPYLAFKNGGGAFLIPYTIMLAFAGLPLFFLECSMGQFSSLGPISVWNVVPILQGVGICMVMITTLVSIYYNVIIAYSLYYLFASFQSVLPWSDCFGWADQKCSKTTQGSCNVSLSDNNITTLNLTWVKENNLTCLKNSIILKDVDLPSKQYWERVALQRSGGLDETGNVVWYLALCLLLAWIIVGASLFKGIKSSGKVVYFTAIFPYVVLIILLVRGATLPGAFQGIDYYIGMQSNFTKLKDAEVWKDAATQIFYSLSTAWGGLIALSSYNKFHNNCYLDAIVVCVANCLTSVFAGFAIFSILGHMAFVSEKSVPDVVDSGFGLAFIAYPEALSQLPVSPLWSFLFFIMLLTLGLDSQFAMIETITTSIQDAFPQIMKAKRIPITIGCCVILFFLGLVCVTQAGIYWVNLIDYFCGGWALLIAAVLELAGISWIYGANRFIKDIEMMIGEKHWIFWLWWRFCWYFVSPLLLAAILLWSLITFESPSFGTIKYPPWGIALGWCMICFCIIWIPVVALLRIVQAKGNVFQACKAAPNWGPALPQHRGQRYQHMPDSKKEKEGEEIPTVSGLTGYENDAYFGSNLEQFHKTPYRLNSYADTENQIPHVYSDVAQVFNKKEAETLPPHRDYDCPIELVPGATVPYGHIFPLSKPELDKLKEYITENLRKGFIRPSTSPAGAGIFFVKNKDKTTYPLPLIPELIERLHGSSIYTKLDLRGAYNLIRVRSGDEWLTAFRTRYGLFEYTVMPFGLCNAPATFQRFINDVFRNLLDTFLVIYLDDILIFSSNITDHIKHFKTVLSRLQAHQLYVKPEKCTFHSSDITFLGYHISSRGIYMEQSKIQTILDWPLLKTRKQVQKCLGFSNFYRKFINNFSAIAKPLTNLTKTDSPLKWNSAAEKAFTYLKKAFTTAPILSYPNPQLQFTLEVDASFYAIGAILSQKDPSPNILHPVAYFSRVLTPSELNYHVGEKELLAMKSSLENWRNLLEGTKEPIIIFTDHRNLEFLKTSHVHSDCPVINDLTNTMSETFSLLTENIKIAQQTQKKYYDLRHGPPPSYAVGDLVWLSMKNLRLTVPCKKFNKLFIGPFSISRIINENAVTLVLPPQFRIHPTFHVDFFKTYTALRNLHSPSSETLPLTPDVEYEVEAILD